MTSDWLINCEFGYGTDQCGAEVIVHLLVMIWLGKRKDAAQWRSYEGHIFSISGIASM